MLIAMIYGNRPQKTYNYSDIVYDFQDQKVTGYSMDWGSGEMIITLKDKSQINYVAPNSLLLFNDIRPYVEDYNKANPTARMVENIKRPTETSWLTSMLPMLITLVIMIGFWWL
jgi:cell division protease FtsH